MRITISENRMIQLGSEDVNRILRASGFFGSVLRNPEITGLKAWLIVSLAKIFQHPCGWCCYNIDYCNKAIRFLLKKHIPVGCCYILKMFENNPKEWTLHSLQDVAPSFRGTSLK